MSNHLSGSKRLAVIQRWLNGRDDPDWEVLPTRKEGKYIVKKRENSIPVKSKTPENSESESEIEEKPRKVQKTQKTQKTPKNYDPTVSEEILNQLKLLGDEIKSKRERKEQKRMIKEVVQKQLKKPKIVMQENDSEDEVEEENHEQEEQIEVPQKRYQRRNRIFEDLM